jgi:2-oxoisovalerate dehydrogenase E1 component
MVANPLQMTHAPKPTVVDWRAVLRHVAISRALDDLEEFTLLRDRKVLYQ